METISAIPSGKFIIGSSKIAKEIKKGRIKSVVIANNTPIVIIEKFQKKGIVVKMFSGNEKALATKIGKPFPIAAIGYEE